MRLANLLEAVAHRASDSFAAFAIEDHQVLDARQAGQLPRFVPEESYFEIRLSQMHLRYEREYWRQFIPVASLMTQFLYAGERRTVPVVVGPELLAGAGVDKTAPVEFRNIRVVGPYPYLGDDVELFVGLFRTVTNDWARRVLSLLESVTKAFDLSKLSTFVNVSGPLVNGVEGLLGMADVELRTGLYRHLATPAEEEAEPGNGTVLRPGFQVLIGAPIDPVEQRRFRVQDGRLWYDQDNRGLVEYDQADFLLVETVPLASRPDYTTFEFHRVYWPKVVEHVWNGRPDAAKEALRLLAANLVQCQDITVAHRNRLLATYRKRFDEELANQQLFEEGAIGQGFEGEARAPLEEAELRAAVQADAVASQTPVGNQPEMLLAGLGL